VDSSQAVAATYRYDPFGNMISSSGSQTSASVYRFSRKEYYTNSGTFYFLRTPTWRKSMGLKPIVSAEDWRRKRKSYFLAATKRGSEMIE
jgi:hypothetical protein